MSSNESGYDRNEFSRRTCSPKLKLHYPTTRDVENGFKKLGYNPKTVTVNGLCTDIYNSFYRTRTELPVEKRNPNRDCKQCPVFGQACDLLGLITDIKLQEHKLWLHSGAMVVVDYQVVCLSDLVSYINERDEKAAKQALLMKQQTDAAPGPADPWVVIGNTGSDYVFVGPEDACDEPFWSYAMRSVAQNLLALVGANTVEG